MPNNGLGLAYSTRMTGRGVLSIWQGIVLVSVRILIPVRIPGARHPPPPPRLCPGLGPIPNGLRAMALAWPGLACQRLPLQVVKGRACSSNSNWGCGSLLAS